MLWSGIADFSSLLAQTTTSGSPVGQVEEWVGTWVPGWILTFLEVGLVLFIAWALQRILVSLFGRRIAQRFERPSLSRTFIRGIRAGVYVVALLSILRIFGLELGDIALSITVLSAVIGVILAPIVGSVIGGVFLLADQPYEIGDMIELADTNQRGFVEDITLRYTKIFTLDNTFLVIPNGTIRERDVVNYSAEDPRMRRSLDVLITYESDLPEARRIFEMAARNVDGVIEGGPDIRVSAARYQAGPTCYINEFGDHGIMLTLRYWIVQPSKLMPIQSQVQTAIWEGIEDADVEIAYPHTHHVFDETTGQLQIHQADQRVPGRSGPDRAPTTENTDQNHDSDSDGDPPPA